MDDFTINEDDREYSDNEEEDEDFEHDIEEEGEEGEEGEEEGEIEEGEVMIDSIKVQKIEINKNKIRKILIVSPDERITDNKLHRNEVAFILAIRSKQIAKYNTHFIGNHNLTNPIHIAYRELYIHKCPFKLRRQVGTTSKGDIIIEEWDVKTMVLPNIPQFSSYNLI